VKIVSNNGHIYIESPAYLTHKDDISVEKELEKKQQNLYLVIRSLKYGEERKHYDIQDKDILKIGRIKFAVKDIGYSAESLALQAETDDGSSDLQEKPHTANSVHTTGNSAEWEEFIEVNALTVSSGADEEKCRFCYSDECDESNPLLKSCKCSGSVSFLHLDCLK